MKHLLSEVSTESSDGRYHGEYRSVLENGVTEIDSCVILKTFAPDSFRFSEQYYGDRTGCEAYLNHIHIDDEGNKARRLDDALAFACDLCSMLRQQAPPGRYCIIVTYHLDCRSTAVRFHRVRVNEWWLSDDLDGYAQEGVGYLVIDVGNLPSTEAC